MEALGLEFRELWRFCYARLSFGMWADQGEWNPSLSATGRSFQMR